MTADSNTLNFTAAMVQQLSVLTDAPMMECNRALMHCDGNMDKAKEFIRCPPTKDSTLLDLLRRVEDLERQMAKLNFKA